MVMKRFYDFRGGREEFWIEVKRLVVIEIRFVVNLIFILDRYIVVIG